MNDKMNDKNKSSLLQALSLGSMLGFSIVVPLIIFLLFGLWLDSKTGASPLFLIVCVLLSFVVVFFDIRYLILPFLEKRSEKNNK